MHENFTSVNLEKIIFLFSLFFVSAKKFFERKKSSKRGPSNMSDLTSTHSSVEEKKKKIHFHELISRSLDVLVKEFFFV